jgi:prevent-host-death family protein
MDHIGAYEAKTHLPRLLDRVERGESLLITRHGRPVACLVPIEAQNRDCAKRAAERLSKRRERLRCVSIDALIETIHEGHKI